MTVTTFPKEMLPIFSTIKPESIVADTQALLAENSKQIDQLLKQTEPFTWENLLHPLETMHDALHQYWSPISHMHATVESEALRKAYNDTQPLLTDYYTALSQNEKLFKAVTSIANSDEMKNLDAAQHKIIENDLRDFRLSGVNLTIEKKQRLAELHKRLNQLTTKFSENVLDATHAWTLPIVNEEELAGLPPQALQLAKEQAKQRGLAGFVLTLDYPSYSTGIKFIKNREIRRALYEAYSTRASDQGPHAGQWDNTSLMEEIVQIRHEIAQLVGFANYAEYSLATKMAKNPEQVRHFLHDLLSRSKPIAEAEYQALIALAKQDGLEQLEAWDVGYYSEKLQESLFNFTQEDLRPYFNLDKVLDGLFTLCQRLFGISLKLEKNIDTWHPDVRFYSLYDEKQNLLGGLYMDLFARPHKRDGAWMDECRSRRLLSAGQLQYPVAYLTCNFMPPVNKQPALLTHDEVLTLFHEFGHCIHHLLTQVNYPPVAGINGVPWDAVEFPSQFLENFCWEKALLDLIAEHHETKNPLPASLYQKMLDAKHFQTGLQMVRQLEFALFDFELHLTYQPSQTNCIKKTLEKIRETISVIKPPAFNRFQNSFSHIFAGSYAAGYYSYKWAEVLSADAYAAFEENGIFDAATGRSFMHNILAVGGVRDPMLSFIAFRGREPTIDALLRHSGIAA